MNHSKEVWKLGNELDHLGIVLVIWSSTIPSVYIGFHCDPTLQQFYIATVSSHHLPRPCAFVDSSNLTG